MLVHRERNKNEECKYIEKDEKMLQINLECLALVLNQHWIG